MPPDGIDERHSRGQLGPNGQRGQRPCIRPVRIDTYTEPRPVLLLSSLLLPPISFVSAMRLFTIIATAALISSVAALTSFRISASAIQARQSAYNASTEYWFDQLIDHSNPSGGTFKQRYFFSDQFWAGNGAPVILNNVGEQSADGFDVLLTGETLQAALMTLYGAAGVVLEHRYWGKSSPYPTLTAETMKFLTVDQAVQDYVYFVSNVQLPFNTTVNTKPDAVPWVNIGCSYPGVLVAYTQEQHSDLFAAGWATSAPVQADGDFMEYWEPVEEGMPQNCSSDLGAAMTYMDSIMSTGTPEQVTELKTKFSMQAVGNDDFGSALTYPLNTWQDLQAYSFANDGESLFHRFCDAIETLPDGTTNTAATGVGMPQALENWAAAFKELGPDGNCPDTGGACYTSYDYTSGQYTDTSVSDTYMRGWLWLMCTELGWFQVGDPGNFSTIISSQITLEYRIRQCNHMFPNADGTPGNYSPSAASNETDATFKGWNLMAQNLYVVNGQYDPWRSASLSSKYAPAYIDTPTQDINVIPNAHHCWDFYLGNAQVDSNVTATQKEGITLVHGWLTNWYTAHPAVSNVLKALPFNDTLISSNSNNSTTEDVPSNGSTLSNSTTGLQAELDRLKSNKKVVLASWILNAILLFALIGLAIAFSVIRRGASRIPAGGGTMPLIPRWGGVKHREDAGEYGAGPTAGGRGKYQQVRE